jgi:hypothetical protein
MTPHLPTTLAVLVAVVVDGVLVPSAPSATLRGGRVVAPLALVARIAAAVETAPDGSVIARRGSRACSARPLRGSEPPVVALAALARCLGADDIRWDGRTKTLALVFDGPVTLRTPGPYDPNAPRVAPTTIFTPEPAPPTPRVITTGSPRPRRTAIPIFTSPSAAPAISSRPIAP